MSQMEH